MSKTKMLLLALACLLATGCVDGVMSTLAPLGPVAERQMSTFMVTLWVSLGIFAVVGSFLVYCIVKFRHTGTVTKDTPLPDQGHGSAFVEIALILISVGLVGVVALPTVQGIFWVGTVPSNEKVYEVNVTGYQWWWKFEYPEFGVVTANEIAIPAGRPVKFNLQAADVLHSFWVPRLGGKMDLVPGQDNWLWLQADPAMLREHAQELHTSSDRFELPDDYPFPGYVLYGQCAEFCGESHAFMRFRVLVLDDTQFNKWIEWQKRDARSDLPENEAEELFKLFQQNRCGMCHAIKGTSARGLVGPDLTHFGSRTSVAAGWWENTPDKLAHWLQYPNEVKPGNTMYSAGYEHIDKSGKPATTYNIKLDDQVARDLAKYLQSLK